MSETPAQIKWEEHSHLNEAYDDCDPDEFVKMLSARFPDIAFRVDFYEIGAWLQVDASQPKTKKYDIRRWLRDNEMLDRYADDDDDDRAYWSIPADYLPAPSAPSPSTIRSQTRRERTAMPAIKPNAK